MTHRTTITLDDELLRQERNNSLKQALIKANQEELQSWESTLSNGLING